MSNFIYGRIVVNDIAKVIDSKIDYSMIEFAIHNNFALHFIDILKRKNTVGEVTFKISDNFMVEYCEYFMEPIIYTLDGKPLTENLCEDINKLQGLIYKIFEFDFVDEIELRFSCAEVDEEDYEICKTCVQQMQDLILEKYLSTTDFPVIKVILEKMVAD